jgi:1-acyl-sn-glycerol-3-phosphate acyltransferase
MISKARHNIFVYSFFKIYTFWKIRRNFNRVVVIGEPDDRHMPVVVISNHISWWDGFWVMYLNMKKFHRKFHFMMLEEQLEKYSFFKKTGGFSVRPGSRSVLETIEHTRELLKDNRNMVLIFPQGEIQSLYRHDFIFEKGIERIIKGKKGEIQIFLNANLVEFHSRAKPALYIFIQEYTLKDLSAEALQNEYNRFYSSNLGKLINRSL